MEYVSAETRFKQWKYRATCTIDLLRTELNNIRNLRGQGGAFIIDTIQSDQMDLHYDIGSPLVYNGWLFTDVHIFQTVAHAVSFKRQNFNYRDLSFRSESASTERYVDALKEAMISVLDQATGQEPEEELYAMIFERVPPPQIMIDQAIIECTSYHAHLAEVESIDAQLREVVKQIEAVKREYREMYPRETAAYGEYDPSDHDLQIPYITDHKVHLDRMCHLISVACDPVRKAVGAAFANSIGSAGHDSGSGSELPDCGRGKRCRRE